jgi:hypothetical protein
LTITKYINSLENEIKNYSANKSKKQWIPIYRIFQGIADKLRKKPNYINHEPTDTDSTIWYLYQTVVLSPAILYLMNYFNS